MSEADIPKRWNCCDMPVPPRDLARHIRDYHMADCRWTESDKVELISIIWVLANLAAISILQ